MRKRRARTKSKADLFKGLTWDDLEAWAGSRVLSRGQSYQRGHRVQELAQTPEGAVVAWVQGGKTYATLVELRNGKLVCSCTCPYGAACKHAVAVILDYLDHLKKNTPVLRTIEKDDRLLLLGRSSDEDESEDEPPETRSESTPSPPNVFLQEKTKEELLNLLKELAGKHSVVREDLQDRLDLSKGSVKKLVASVRKEIHELSSEPGWRNHWNNEGHIPDYSRVKDRLEALLAKGYADEVVILGKELLEAGMRQVEMSHDEGETGMEISSCLEVVFRALPQSSLSPVEQMLWVIDAAQEDEYDLCYGSESFWKKKQKSSDWSTVADILIDRLNTLPQIKSGDRFTRDYRRDGLSNWIIRALENSGRKDEIIPLCEQEAVKTKSYERLVDALVSARRFEEAERWIHKGIQATRKELPGIASHLRNTLREMREKEGNWSKVAAFRADDFLGSPSLHTFNEMRKASERAKVWPAVRAAALLYLETGKMPHKDVSWPLPETGAEDAEKNPRTQFPATAVLIDIAIAEKRTDDILRWYDYQKSKKKGIWGWDAYQDESVAKAVADRYPDRAIAIWKEMAERQIALTKPSAYRAASEHLKKAQDLLKKLKREDEWKAYLSNLRQANGKKRSFLEVLDRLERRPIIKT